MSFLPSLFLIVESWTLTLIEASEACSSLDVALGCNSGRPTSPGKVHHCPKFSPFVGNGSHKGLLESQILRNGFVTLSRLIHLNYFFLICFSCCWISLDRGMMCCFFRSFSMLHFVIQVLFTFTFSYLADAFIQSDLQMRTMEAIKKLNRKGANTFFTALYSSALNDYCLSVGNQENV